jgi:hypothetical protein
VASNDGFFRDGHRDGDGGVGSRQEMIAQPDNNRGRRGGNGSDREFGASRW